MSNRPLHGGNLAWAAALAGCSPDAILDFSASINPLGPPESALLAIQAHLADLKVYPDPNYQNLRARLARIHDVPPEWILPGNGSAELLTWAGRDLSQFETTYLVTPAFGDYIRALNTFSTNIVKCPLVNAEWDSQVELGKEGNGQWLEKLPIPDFLPMGNDDRALLLNNPHNPTGVLFLRETILPTLDRFGLVVVDEAFMDFLPAEKEQSLISLVQEYPNLVILRSLTKFYSLPGLRLGYAIAHPDRLQRWQQWRDPWPVNVLAAAAACAVLEDRAFEQQTRYWLEEARNQLFVGLSQLPGLHPFPSAANFLLVQSSRSSSLIQEKLLKQSQILIRDCLSFPELGDRYFRVAVRLFSENQRLLEGLAAICEEMRG